MTKRLIIMEETTTLVVFVLTIVSVLVVLLPELCVSMRFDLESGDTKCITEDIKHDSLTVGKYSVVSPNESLPHPLPDPYRTTVRVTSPRGHIHHYVDGVESGDFAFTALESGDYAACFWAPYHTPPQFVTIEFDWTTGIDTRDWSKVAQKGNIDFMEMELERIHQTIKIIHDEMFYLREREEQMQTLNKGTNSRMAFFSFLSLLICFAVAALQLWHLKTFFEKKKLL